MRRLCHCFSPSVLLLAKHRLFLFLSDFLILVLWSVFVTAFFCLYFYWPSIFVFLTMLYDFLILILWGVFFTDFLRLYFYLWSSFSVCSSLCLTFPFLFAEASASRTFSSSICQALFVVVGLTCEAPSSLCVVAFFFRFQFVSVWHVLLSFFSDFLILTLWGVVVAVFPVLNMSLSGIFCLFSQTFSFLPCEVSSSPISPFSTCHYQAFYSTSSSFFVLFYDFLLLTVRGVVADFSCSQLVTVRRLSLLLFSPTFSFLPCLHRRLSRSSLVSFCLFCCCFVFVADFLILTLWGVSAADFIVFKFPLVTFFLLSLSLFLFFFF